MYAEALVDFVASAQHFRPQAAAYDLAIRVGTVMDAWIDLPLPHFISHLWDQEGGFLQQQSAGEQHAATIEAIHKAVASHVGKMHQQRITTFRALQQAVAVQMERLHLPPDTKLQTSLKNLHRDDVFEVAPH